MFCHMTQYWLIYDWIAMTQGWPIDELRIIARSEGLKQSA